MSLERELAGAPATESNPTVQWTAPRDVATAIRAHTPDGRAFLVVVLRADMPWLVPDTPAARNALDMGGIAVRPLADLRAETVPGAWDAANVRRAQVAVTVRDRDGIAWLLMVMKAGVVHLLLDDPATRLAVVSSGVPLVAASVSDDHVTRLTLPNG